MKIVKNSAVITGAGSGLGAAVARMLAAEGARVGLLDTNMDRVGVLAEELGGVAAYGDVSDASAAATAVELIAEKNGFPRILVHCAGITIGRVPLVGGDREMRFTKFDKVMRINLNGTLNMISLVAEQMVKLEPLEQGERGVIILTASFAAYEGQVGMSAYSASKGGVVSLILPCARELAAYGIRVNAVAPGYFNTPLLEGLPDWVRSGLAASYVYPKRMGEAPEYAQLVMHMIHNTMLNGETIRLDGAMRLPPSFAQPGFQEG
ncbi:MAG: SDR family NAD(P)-dependent oxidoreductase [Desulfatirhabdiaceae bacterium]